MKYVICATCKTEHPKHTACPNAPIPAKVLAAMKIVYDWAKR
jgi:hypothetical protein